jgi:hypothetical protein
LESRRRIRDGVERTHGLLSEPWNPPACPALWSLFGHSGFSGSAHVEALAFEPPTPARTLVGNVTSEEFQLFCDDFLEGRANINIKMTFLEYELFALRRDMTDAVDSGVP